MTKKSLPTVEQVVAELLEGAISKGGYHDFKEEMCAAGFSPEIANAIGEDGLEVFVEVIVRVHYPVDDDLEK